MPKFLEDTLPFSAESVSSLPFSRCLNRISALDKLANIDIHDLMNREPIELYDEHVAETLKGKTTLVTGAAGSIGSEIVLQTIGALMLADHLRYSSESALR